MMGLRLVYSLRLIYVVRYGIREIHSFAMHYRRELIIRKRVLRTFFIFLCSGGVLFWEERGGIIWRPVFAFSLLITEFSNQIAVAMTAILLLLRR